MIQPIESRLPYRKIKSAKPIINPPTVADDTHNAVLAAAHRVGAAILANGDRAAANADDLLQVLQHDAHESKRRRTFGGPRLDGINMNAWDGERLVWL